MSASTRRTSKRTPLHRAVRTELEALRHGEAFPNDSFLQDALRCPEQQRLARALHSAVGTTRGGRAAGVPVVPPGWLPPPL